MGDENRMEAFSGRQTRSVPQRSAATPATSVAPQAPAVDSRPRAASGHPSQNTHNKKKPTLGIVAAALAVGIVAAALWWGVGAVASSPIEKNKYQAIFLTNSQVYFGKLVDKGSQYVLTDVYYLQASAQNDSANPQQAGGGNSDVQLIKLGNEIHGPEDQMIISKDQVLFYENLKSNSKVASSIQKYKSSN